ncbi:MAG: AraC family transcriptional regulator [Clostridia bacterium]|nr:AraC family transcriptional regulator [Clostridia bacterium]
MERIFRETKQEISFFKTTCLDFSGHLHEDIEVVLVRKGTAVAYCDGVQYRLRAGSFFMVFPNQVHHYIDSNAGEYILLIVKPERHNLLFDGRPLSCVCEQADANAIALLEIALSEYENSGYTAVVASCLTAFFEKLLTFYQIEKGTPQSNIALGILHYCSEHYTEDITITDIAKALHVSKSAVSHTFKKRLGVGFIDHIHALRLMDAVRLLQGDQYSITEIADLSGFSTVRTFNRAFQKQYGMSPSEYRKRR